MKLTRKKKLVSILLAIGVVSLVTLLLLITSPVRINISSAGLVSISSTTALATGEEETRKAGLYIMSEGWYEYVSGNRDVIEIGNKETADFRPHLKLNRWNGECFIKIGLVTGIKGSHTIEGDKIRWSGPKVDTCFYSPELNKFEFEIILKEKPTSNQIVLEIETEGLKFYYQPELTPKEIAEGYIRPENVIGSYAVYHATRTSMHRSQVDAEKYKCGKAFHIYRPKVTDTNGNWIWADLNIQDGTLTIAINQTWLNNAVYPVSIDPDFGYTDIGGTEGGFKNKLWGPRGTPAEIGTGDYIKFYNGWNSTEQPTYLCGLYKTSDNSLLANSQTERQNSPEEIAWVQSNFVTAPSISPIEYYVVAYGGGGTLKGIKYMYDSETDSAMYQNMAYTGVEDLPASVTPTGTSVKMSIYCTYTPAEGEANISNVPSSKAFGTVAADTSYWSKGSAPTFPLDDDECYFTVTNNGDTCSITIKATNFTGGVGWTLGIPAEDVIRLKAGKSGDANEETMVTLTTSPQAFISGLVTSIKWELKMETPTSYTDGVEKTSTITLTAALD